MPERTLGVLKVELNPEFSAAREAEEEFRAAVKLDRGNAKYHAELGSVLGNQDKWAQAISACGEAVRLDPKNSAYKSAHKNARQRAK